MDDINAPNFYSIIPADLRYDNRLKAVEKLFFSEISALTTVHGYCYAGNKYFSKLYKCEVRTISRWLQNLEKCGYIKVEILRDNRKFIIERRIYTRESWNAINQNSIEKTVDNNVLPPIDKNVYTPMDKNVYTPIDKNVLNNNIYINNIIHNKEMTGKEELAEKVFIKKEEYEELKNTLGEEKAKRCLTELSLYKKSKNVEYADDYSAIKRWVIKKIDGLYKPKDIEKSIKHKSYSQEEIDDLEKFYDIY